MGFEKAIEHHKEHRKPYKGAKSVSLHCRNHGGCPWCESNRLHNTKKREEFFEEQLKNYKYEI